MPAQRGAGGHGAGLLHLGDHLLVLCVFSVHPSLPPSLLRSVPPSIISVPSSPSERTRAAPRRRSISSGLSSAMHPRRPTLSSVASSVLRTLLECQHPTPGAGDQEPLFRCSCAALNNSRYQHNKDTMKPNKSTEASTLTERIEIDERCFTRGHCGSPASPIIQPTKPSEQCVARTLRSISDSPLSSSDFKRRSNSLKMDIKCFWVFFCLLFYFGYLHRGAQCLQQLLMKTKISFTCHAAHCFMSRTECVRRPSCCTYFYRRFVQKKRRKQNKKSNIGPTHLPL